GSWLIGRCRELGLNLCRVVMIPDQVDAIAQEVLRCSEEFDLVFTTGGVGPTHDDITMQAIAQAFSSPMIRSPELESIIRTALGDRYNEDAGSMADLPEGAVLLQEDELFFPLVQVRNVYVFPGVPELMKRKFEGIAPRFQGSVRHCVSLITAERETAIAQRLRDVQSRWPLLEIGSYPQFTQRPWTVTVTIDGSDMQQVESCRQELLRALHLDGTGP
ncbi:MAG: molybdopterin-binding protein, partial [Myxococcota bacterium]|nr:molybdopterin-binding protein [Myxococcota bacterium]